MCMCGSLVAVALRSYFEVETYKGERVVPPRWFRETKYLFILNNLLLLTNIIYKLLNTIHLL